MGDFDIRPEAVRLGFDFNNALSDSVVEMRRRWSRKNIDWKVSDEGIEVQGMIDSLDNLCAEIENLLPVNEEVVG